jgi:hypothetical protein
MKYPTFKIKLQEKTREFTATPEEISEGCAGCNAFGDSSLCDALYRAYNCTINSVIFKEVNMPTMPATALTPEIVKRVMKSYMNAENGWRDNERKCISEIIQLDNDFLAKEKMKNDPEYAEFLRLAEKFKDIVV